jgi:PAS domain S-box-containing protein
MFSKISLKTKLIIPIFAITTILLLLGFMLITSKYSQILSLERLNYQIVLSSKISNLVHSLQKERGLSSGYIINNNGKFRKELQQQMVITNKYLNEIDFKDLTKNSVSLLNNLSKIRKKILKYELSTDKTIEYYSNLNDYLLDVIINITSESFVPNISKNLLAYSYLIYAKEFSGIERAFGITILTKSVLEKKLLIKFTNYISMQNQNIKMFLKYASEDTKSYYKNISSNDAFKKVEEIRTTILYQNISKSKIDSKYWYGISTKKINLYQNVISYIKNLLQKEIEYELKVTKNIFYMVLGLTILSFIVFIMMIIAFLRLAKEEQRLRIVMDKYIISSITDLKGKIIDVSQAFCNISGYTKAELIGKNHNIVRHPDMPKSAFKDLWDDIKAGKSWKGKVKNKTKDGGFYWVYANIEPLYNSKGEVDAYISIRLDITESELLLQNLQQEEEKNKRNQQMIQQQSRLAQMGEMLSMIAHQWRQPLSAISASSAVIYLKASRDKLDKDTAIELSNKIKDFSQHLSSTIDDFRDFFKTNKKQSSTNFSKILDSVLGIVSSSLEQNNITLNLDDRSHKDFETYENELKQVLLNLIKNAEDALVENSVEDATINVCINDNILFVKDNAGGISEDIIDKIFDPYFSTKTKKDGTGLGLYMSKTIIEEHCNGKLYVENEDNGAKFTIIVGDKDD